MTYKEKYLSVNNWREKAVIVRLFHLKQKIKNKKWTLRMTAKYFGISHSLVSENIKLARMNLDAFSSRNKALRFLRYGYEVK